MACCRVHSALHNRRSRTTRPTERRRAETFEAKDFVRTGLVMTVIAFALVMILGATYWRWLGYV